MNRAWTVGLATLMVAGINACAEDGLMTAPVRSAPTAAVRTRSLALARPSSGQATQLAAFSQQEGRPIDLQKDPFGHGVLGPTLSAPETTLVKTLDAADRSVEETASRTLPGGLKERATAHFRFFYPTQKAQPQVMPLHQTQSGTLLGFRAEVDMSGPSPEDGHDLYFAYYDADGRLLQANQ